MQECNLIFEGYERRRREEWAKVQRIAYIIAQVNSRKKLDPDDIVNLKVFDQDWEPEAPETEEDHEKVKARVRARQSAIARMLAAQAQDEQKGPEAG